MIKNKYLRYLIIFVIIIILFYLINTYFFTNKEYFYNINDLPIITDEDINTIKYINTITPPPDPKIKLKMEMRDQNDSGGRLKNIYLNPDSDNLEISINKNFEKKKTDTVERIIKRPINNNLKITKIKLEFHDKVRIKSTN